jgi:hypothetical protein
MNAREEGQKGARPLFGAAAMALCAVVMSPMSMSAQAPAPAPGAAAQATPPAPRFPDGHLNLGSAPGQKGYWEVRPGLGGFPRQADVPFQPWAKALAEYRASRVDLYPPLVNCKPGPGPSFFNAPGFEIVDVPDLKTIFILNIAGPHSWRAIYMDGRAHPTGDDLRPTYLGHSVGHWEGDTLVIDSVGFNEKMWAGGGGFPSTGKLHLIEKISRPDLTTLSYEVTVDDPGAYTKPWSGKWTITAKTASKWIPGGEMFEYICQDSRYGPE